MPPGEMKHGPIALIDDDGAGDRPRPVRAVVREDRQQHAGSPRARRQDRADQRRARDRRSGRRLHGDDRNARGSPADRAAGLCGSGAAARLSCGGAQRAPTSTSRATSPRASRWNEAYRHPVAQLRGRDAVLPDDVPGRRGAARSAPAPRDHADRRRHASYDGGVGQGRPADASKHVRLRYRQACRGGRGFLRLSRQYRAYRAGKRRRAVPDPGPATSARSSPTRRSATGGRRSRSSAPTRR